MIGVARRSCRDRPTHCPAHGHRRPDPGAVRFFGGWEFTKQDARTRLPAEIGYMKGVPMGGDLRPAPQDAKAPTFLVAAMKDAWSGNLDRIQIVKGWLDGRGKALERVYDVAVSDGRTPRRGPEPIGLTTPIPAPSPPVGRRPAARLRWCRSRLVRSAARCRPGVGEGCPRDLHPAR